MVVAVLASGVWLLVAGVGAAYAVVLLAGGDTNCPAAEGGSDYGTFAWSRLPPGPTCTFTQELNGFAEVRGPTPVMTLWLLALVAGAVACAVVLRWALTERLSTPEEKR